MSYGKCDGVHCVFMVVTNEPLGGSRPTEGSQQVLIQGTRHSESPIDAQVAVERSAAPSSNRSRPWPGG